VSEIVAMLLLDNKQAGAAQYPTTKAIPAASNQVHPDMATTTAQTYPTRRKFMDFPLRQTRWYE
jgi:hypothetical protein